MLFGEAKDIGVDEKLVVSAAALKDLREAAEEKMYWKGRADGLEYVIDTLQSVFELISEGRN